MFGHCRRNILISGLLLALAAALAGCGQKGPLYIHSELDAGEQQMQAELRAQEQEAQADGVGPSPGLEAEPGSLIPSP